MGCMWVSKYCLTHPRETHIIPIPTTHHERPATMPYSKDPHKYPAEMLQLLDSLRHYPGTQMVIACAYPQEANSRKVQIQSFFRAVERYAEEQNRLLTVIRAKASTTADRRDRAAADTAAEYSTAREVAQTWEDRAFVARKWMVRVQASPLAVVVQQRVLEGKFGDSLQQILASAPAPGRPVPPPADSLEEQLALLRSATQQLEQNLSKTD